MSPLSAASAINDQAALSALMPLPSWTTRIGGWRWCMNVSRATGRDIASPHVPRWKTSLVAAVTSERWHVRTPDGRNRTGAEPFRRVQS